MSNEEIISNYLQTAYSDAQLAALLAHCEDGKLAFFSCCCVAGIPTADHALQGENYGERNAHWVRPYRLGGIDVSHSFNALSRKNDEDEANIERRAKLIPLILAEMDRREALKIPEAGRGDSVVTEAQAGVLTGRF